MAGLPEATGVLPHNTNRPHSTLNKLAPTEFAEHVSSGIGQPSCWRRSTRQSRRCFGILFAFHVDFDHHVQFILHIS